MFLDHIGEFISNSPILFRDIGRLSMPLFFFVSTVGLKHTHNINLYLKRLFFCSLIMAYGNLLISIIFKRDIILSNNIFATIFLGCIVSLIFNETQKAVLSKKIIVFISYQFISFLICFFLSEILSFPSNVDTRFLYSFYGSIFFNILFVEGGPLTVIYFVFLYKCYNNKIFLIIFNLIYSLLIFLLTHHFQYYRGIYEYLIPFANNQWIMVFSIPFFVIYNGLRGGYKKKFFYFIYPIHIWLLYILGKFI